MSKDFMDTNEKNEGVDNPEGNEGVDDQSLNEGNEDGSIDSLLNDLDGDDNDVIGDGEVEVDDSDKGDDKSEEFKIQIGNHSFDKKEDFVKFAKQNYGEVSRLIGENKKLQEMIGKKEDVSQDGQDSDNQDDKGKPESQLDKESLYREFKVKEYYEGNPGSEDYKSLMAALIRSNKASIEGKVDLDLAYAKALKSDGKKIPESVLTRLRDKTGKGESNTEIKKNIMKSEGGVGGRSASTYESEEDVNGVSDFADKALFGL
jgi:hypothetical protein